MRGFSFKNSTFLLIIASLVWFLSTEICSARRGKIWRHDTAIGSRYKNKVKHYEGQRQVNVDSSTPWDCSKFNVLDYGAKGDGKSDDTEAFQAAWMDACKIKASTVIVPLGYEFVVGPTSFSGSNCLEQIILQLEGTMLAPTNTSLWGSGCNQWLEFIGLKGFTIKGKGTFDGRGSVWWTEESIHDSTDNKDELVSLDNIPNSEDLQVSSSLGDKRPKARPMALRFIGSSDVTVTGITIQNSPQFHIRFDNCDGVMVYDINIASPGDSPNTDGIHLNSSKNVIIHHANLACGDDCISLQTGCTNILVHDVNCGPGHGISIGSLGLHGTTACVSNITVKNVKFHDTMTGVRIKTWQGATGLVRGVLFSNIQVSEVEFPIMIDQYYCDHSRCKNQTSAVSITNVTYENIWGTYTVQPVHLSCSDSRPCTHLNLSDINLKPNGREMSKPFCWQAFGKLNSPMIPEVDCLLEGDSSNSLDLDNSRCVA